MEGNKIVLSFTKNEALVLFEFVCRFSDDKELSIQDQAEERVLWNMCGSLEKVLAEPFDPDYETILQQARDEVRDKE